MVRLSKGEDMGPNEARIVCRAPRKYERLLVDKAWEVVERSGGLGPTDYSREQLAAIYDRLPSWSAARTRLAHYLATGR